MRHGDCEISLEAHCSDHDVLIFPSKEATLLLYLILHPHVEAHFFSRTFKLEEQKQKRNVPGAHWSKFIPPVS